MLSMEKKNLEIYKTIQELTIEAITTGKVLTIELANSFNQRSSKIG